MIAAALRDAGYAVLPPDPRVARWAAAALPVAMAALTAPAADPARHGGTWFAGVDVLDNAPDGSVAGVPLAGPWEGVVARPEVWHRAQVSVTRPGYPGRDPSETDAAHGYRMRRDAAHVDGLLAVGPARRRFLMEPHAWILGIPLTEADPGAAPLVVWDGSPAVMGQALGGALAATGSAEWDGVDLTEVYAAARRRAFETCDRRELPLRPGQSILLHRHALHGTAPWRPGAGAAPQGRAIAFFRPVLTRSDDWTCAG